jgi:hypothetical protein
MARPGHELVESQPLSSEDVSTEAEEYPLLGAVTGQRLVKTDVLMFGVVICGVCRSMKLLELPVVVESECSINPNPKSSH